MKKLLILLCLLATPTFAADNYTATQGSGKTFRCIELGGTICYPGYINFNSSGTEIFTLAVPGTVTLSNSSVSVTQSTSPWVTSITQGGNTAVVKPASGAPSAADPALVVGISPNSWDVGSGTGGTKTQRIYNDSTQVAVGATATTAPANAIYNGFLSGSNLVGVSAANPFPVIISSGTVTISNTNLNGQALMANSSPVAIASNQSNLPVIGGLNVTATDCSAALTTGFTAQNLITAGATLHGVTVMDIDTAKTEGIWVSFTGTASANTIGSYYIPPYNATSGAGSYSSPMGFGFNGNLSAVAATSGHKVSCTKW